jgi:hypothetical protein
VVYLDVDGEREEVKRTVEVKKKKASTFLSVYW